MNRYVLPQTIAFLLMFTGWLVTIGGSALCILYINKPSLLNQLGFLPKVFLQKLGTTPDWFFFTPVGICILFGLLVVGVGHILQVCVDNARNSHEALAMLDIISGRSAHY